METACVDSSFKEFDGLRGMREIEGSWQGLGSREGRRESLKGTLQACVSMQSIRVRVLMGKTPFPHCEGLEVWALKLCPWGLSCSGLSSGQVRKAQGK